MKFVFYANTDWYGLLYKDQTPTAEHSLSVSRSTDKANFLLSGRYLNQPGLIRYNSDDYRLLNLRATGQVELYPWLQLNNNLMASNRKYFNPLNVGEGGGIWRNIADEGHPSEPMLNPDGTLTWSGAYTVGDYYYGKNGSDLTRNLVLATVHNADPFDDWTWVIANWTVLARAARDAGLAGILVLPHLRMLPSDHCRLR